MAITSRKRTIRKLVREATSRTSKVTPAARAKLRTAAKTLEKAAATYAKRASEAGVAAGKTVKRMTRTRKGKILAAAALAAAGYAASRVIRGK